MLLVGEGGLGKSHLASLIHFGTCTHGLPMVSSVLVLAAAEDKFKPDPCCC